MSLEDALAWSTDRIFRLAEQQEELEPPKKKTKIAASAKGKGKEKEEEALAEVDSSDEQTEENRVKDKGKGKEVATEDAVTESLPKHPTPAVMNLLISTIFADIAKLETVLAEDLPDCPCKKEKEVAKLLNTVGPFKTQGQLSRTFDNPESDADNLLVYFASRYGTDILPAEGYLKIPGFQNELMQFVIVKPRLSMQEAWEKEFAKESKKSNMFFHGTGYPNFQSILRNGFCACMTGAGVYLAAAPSASNAYAAARDIVLDKK